MRCGHNKELFRLREGWQRGDLLACPDCGLVFILVVTQDAVVSTTGEPRWMETNVNVWHGREE